VYGEEHDAEGEMQELAVEVLPLFDRGGPEDEQDHDNRAGDEGLFGEEPKEQQKADAEFEKGEGIREGRDESLWEKGLCDFIW
jgi:hypothetical protein